MMIELAELFQHAETCNVYDTRSRITVAFDKSVVLRPKEAGNNAVR